MTIRCPDLPAASFVDRPGAAAMGRHILVSMSAVSLSVIWYDKTGGFASTLVGTVGGVAAR